MYQSLLGNTTSTPIEMPGVPNETGEPVIRIDAGLRVFVVPKSLKTIGVRGDNKAERIIFQISRFFDGKDLSEHTFVLCCKNAGGEYREYTLTDIVSVTTDAVGNDDDYLLMYWEIDNYVTAYSGEIEIAMKVITDGVYQWSCLPTKLKVLEGMNVDSTVINSDNGALVAMQRQIDNLTTIVNTNDALVQSYESRIAALESTIETMADDIDYIRNHVVWTVTTVPDPVVSI